MAPGVRHRHMSTVYQMSHFIGGQGTPPLYKCTNYKVYIVKVPIKIIIGEKVCKNIHGTIVCNFLAKMAYHSK